ncbi:MAG: type II secretion system F family protein [Candidatus Bathyarchaeia archaeon]
MVMANSAANHNRAVKSLPYFSYKILGEKLDFLYSHFNGLKTDLAKANIRISLKAYVCQMVFTSILSTLISFGVFSALNLAVPSLLRAIFPQPWTQLLTLLVAPLAVGSGTFLIQYSLPAIKIEERSRRIERFLPTTSSYMSVLACAGADPEKIIRSAAAEDSKMLLSEEFRSIVVRMDLLGYDILTALDEGARLSPTPIYANLLKGLAYTIRTGGDLKKFFLKMTKQLLSRRNLLIQQFIHTLGVLAETYVLMFAAFPLLLIIMLSLMASVGGTLGGIDFISFMYLLAFLIMPIMAALYIFLIDIIQVKG